MEEELELWERAWWARPTERRISTSRVQPFSQNATREEYELWSLAFNEPRTKAKDQGQGQGTSNAGTGAGPSGYVHSGLGHFLLNMNVLKK